MSAAQRGRSFRSCLLCTHHYYTTLHINCGLASVFTFSDPYRSCPPPSPPHCRRTNHKTNSNISPTHLALQAALRPCCGGLGVEQVWIKLSKNPTEHYGPCDTDSPFFPFEIFFFLLLSTALVGTEGNSSSFIGHTLTRERKIQAIKLLWCLHIYVLPSYSHPIPTPFSSCSSLGPFSTIQQLIWKPHGYHEITNRYPSSWPNYHTVCVHQMRRSPRVSK